MKFPLLLPIIEEEPRTRWRLDLTELTWLLAESVAACALAMVVVFLITGIFYWRSIKKSLPDKKPQSETETEKRMTTATEGSSDSTQASEYSNSPPFAVEEWS
jgi:hypothetical protein